MTSPFGSARGLRMYERHYHFRKKPFDLLPDPDFFYLSGKHQRAMSLLEYGLLDQAGFIVVTGEVGTGKTTLIRSLIRRKQAESRLRVAVIFNTQLSPEELLEPVLEAFRLPYQGKSRTERLSILRDFLRREATSRSQTALIIDEAQNLPLETLEEIRLLTNMETESRHLMQIVLVGQPGLRAKLSNPVMLPFAQRILYDYHLQPLDLRETAEYVHHRLKVAQARDLDLFSQDAIEQIHQFSGGIPRLINLIGHTALVYGFADKLSKIGREVIQEVVRDWEVGRHLQPHGRPLQTTSSSPDFHTAHGDIPVDSAREIRDAVERIRIEQQHMLRILERLLSERDANPDSPSWLQPSSTADSAQTAARKELDAWLRTRKILEDKDQEVQALRKEVRNLQEEIDRLKGRNEP